MTALLGRAATLKQELVDFVYDAEDELATAMEQSVADQLKHPVRDINQSDLALDRFLTAGEVQDGKTPIDYFIAAHADLPERDRALLQRWKRSFLGLFAVTDVLPDGFRLMNWMTAKPYTVQFTDAGRRQDMERLQPRDIILSRISPVTDTEWMFSGPYVLKGRLGKPKLAVAVGRFKDDHWETVYGDAPDLLEEAWQSVERYHTTFVDFFGSDEVTLSGRELSKKLDEFQQQLTERHLAAAGIDPSKSLSDMAAEAGVDPEDIDAIAGTLGMNPETLSKVLLNPRTSKMAAPKIELPPDLKRAEQITVLAHPRWGQSLLQTYQKFRSLLQAEPEPFTPESQALEKLVRTYLKDPSISTFVWRRLEQDLPQPLEKAVQRTLDRPEFKLDRDLDALLQEYGKPLQPTLPEIASVPLHLNDLFQEALAEVSKPKKRKKKTKSKGFR